jgi:hypothetical protein
MSATDQLLDPGGASAPPQSRPRGTWSRALRGRKAAATAAVGLGCAALIGLAAPAAQANAGSCTQGLNTATTAWGHCNRVTNNGYYGFRLVVNCYYYPQQISYGIAPQSIYASCPSWSHVTWEQAQPWAG